MSKIAGVRILRVRPCLLLRPLTHALKRQRIGVSIFELCSRIEYRIRMNIEFRQTTFSNKLVKL